MNTNLLFDFSVDKENETITVKREFAAPLDKVWAAWTESQRLDKWWAPKPWKSETKSMDFREGGKWIYAMVGPNGEKHWSIAHYKNINPMKSYSAQDGFSDENGNINKDMPQALWTTSFSDEGDHTMVTIVIKYDNGEDLKKYLEMGFKEGFTAGLENLDDLLAS